MNRGVHRSALLSRSSGEQRGCIWWCRASWYPPRASVAATCRWPSGLLCPSSLRIIHPRCIDGFAWRRVGSMDLIMRCDSRKLVLVGRGLTTIQSESRVLLLCCRVRVRRLKLLTRALCARKLLLCHGSLVGRVARGESRQRQGEDAINHGIGRNRVPGHPASRLRLRFIGGYITGGCTMGDCTTGGCTVDGCTIGGSMRVSRRWACRW